MALPHGFKARANAIARQARMSMGLPASAPLSPWRLAEKMAIAVSPLSSFASECGDAVRQLMEVDSTAFSAGTFQLATTTLIVFNDAHAKERQASDVAHELAHLLLDHPMRPILDKRGCRHIDRELEEQANWLGPALLISDEAALCIARQSWTIKEAAREYEVTQEVARFRMNVTAAYKRVA